MATPTWKRYENRAAAFFRKLGFEVETGAKLPGPRAVYAVDLVARRSAYGIDLTWDHRVQSLGPKGQ